MSEPCSLSDVQEILNKIKGNYFLNEWGKPIPICEGCFNVDGDCGTPCICCERHKAWNDTWKWELMFDEKYIIWKRKTETKK